MPRVRVSDLEIAFETDGSGEPLLLLMGLGGDRHGWALVRPELARRHQLILVDNRDAGESGQASVPYGLGDMASDALAVMDALGIERFHVAGASMGGAIAQHLALQAPHRVASLVLVATWGRTDPLLAAIFRSWRTAAAQLAPEAFQTGILPWAFTYRYFAAPPAELARLQTSWRERGVPFSVPAYQRQVDACLQHDLLAVLPMLRTPTLVLVGEDDVLTPARYARGLATSIVGAEVGVVPASGHAAFLETPKPVAERMLRFLARHRA